MAERGFLDQAIDFADGVVGTLEAATGGGTPAAPSRSESARPSGFAPAAPTSGSSSSRSWRIIEVIRDDHEIDYIVTDGREEVSCSTRELAEKVRDAFR